MEFMETLIGTEKDGNCLFLLYPTIIIDLTNMVYFMLKKLGFHKIFFFFQSSS